MDRDAYLLHQVHGAKLATDIAADVISTWLMWHERPRAALAVAHLAAGLASGVLIRQDLSALRATRRGRYVLTHMPPSAQAVRYSGQLLGWYAARRHRPGWIVAGHLVIGLGWSHGLLARH